MPRVQEMVRAQRELHSQLQAERASIDRQHAELDWQRREIAQRRGRDPIVAEAIRGIGVLLVCLVPLIVAIYALSRLDRGQPESEALSELLVHELVRDEPVLEVGFRKSGAGRTGSSGSSGGHPPTSLRR